MARRKKHGEEHEEHMDESWLVPYADILTLLLALFIVLYASSQVDQKKFQAMAASLNSAFSGNTSIFDNMRSVPQVQEVPPQQKDKMPSVMTNMNENREQEYLRESVQLAEVKRMLDKYIQDNSLTGDLETMLTDHGLMIRIKDTALFPSGSAELKSDSKKMAVEIAKMLAPLSQQVIISGHTDNAPINTWEFPSNWDLSSKRSLNFMKFLLSQEEKLKPERFSATGYGEYRPVMPNDSPAGRSKNRRVEVMILRNVR